MYSREQRAALAADTLKILQNGAYINDARIRVDFSSELNFAIENTTVVAPEKQILVPTDKQRVFQTEITVEEATTLKAAHRLALDLVQSQEHSKVGVLNFASAKRPGGGFLGGSSAQEESIARSSALYYCLKDQTDYYEANKKERQGLYTDYIIYSPAVPVFRCDAGTLLEQPYYVGIITAPAPNAGVARTRMNKGDENIITQTLKERADRVLSVAVEHNHFDLVLGAWGCGVFRNNPTVVASIFRDLLKTKFNNCFRKVVFAIADIQTCEKFAHVFRLGVQKKSL